MITQKFQCLQCGYQFKVEVLTDEEKEEAKRRGAPISYIDCSRCHSKNIRRI